MDIGYDFAPQCYNKSMDSDTLRLLLSPSGQEALQAAMALEPREVDYLVDFS